MPAGKWEGPVHDATGEDREDSLGLSQAEGKLCRWSLIARHRMKQPTSSHLSRPTPIEVANHYVYAYPPYCELKYNSGNDKCWVWTTMDYSEDVESSCFSQCCAGGDAGGTVCLALQRRRACAAVSSLEQ